MSVHSAGSTHTEVLFGGDEAELALFRRAICEQDDVAWQSIIDQYRGLVLATIRRHYASRWIAEDDLYWVNQTFERFWKAVRPERFQNFKDLQSILGYLKMCALSVLMDAVRARRRVECLGDGIARSCDSAEVTDHADYVANSVDSAVLWATIQGLLTDEQERLIAHLSFVYGMAPRDIFARRPDRFTSITEVYRGKRVLLERLRKSPELQRFVSPDPMAASGLVDGGTRPATITSVT